MGVKCNRNCYHFSSSIDSHSSLRYILLINESCAIVVLANDKILEMVWGPWNFQRGGSINGRRGAVQFSGSAFNPLILCMKNSCVQCFPIFFLNKCKVRANLIIYYNFHGVGGMPVCFVIIYCSFSNVELTLEL